MATVTHKGNPIHTSGTLPAVGSTAPDFKLTGSDLADVSLANYAGKVKVLNINPSLDTGICALSAKRFDAEIAKLGGTVVLNVSRDLPFAASRFCKGEGLTTIIPLSEMRNRDFGKTYGVAIEDGVLAGLLARSVVVVDKQDKVVYTQQVPEIGQEPDYAKAIEAAKKAMA
ncbi:MAG TPA: thiol peroxidase [Rectinemataceae bacterium]|nr:thiol peroxidase [Rectinemataceae bacterium]